MGSLTTGVNYLMLLVIGHCKALQLLPVYILFKASIFQKVWLSQEVLLVKVIMCL